MDDQLIVMKKSRKNPNTGDVFVLQPYPGTYYYGKVIDSNVVSTDSFINGMYLIYVFDYMTNGMELPVGLDENELLIPPMVINKRPWTMGFIETIGNIPVTIKEKNLDYGFFELVKRIYVDIHGDVINKEPAYHSIYGLGSYGILAKEIYKALKER